MRFYTVGVRRKETCCRGLVIITCDGRGGILLGNRFQNLGWFGGGGKHFQIRDCVTFGVIFVNFTFWP